MNRDFDALVLATRLEESRRRLRAAAIEAEARRALPPAAVRRLEDLGLFSAPDSEHDAARASEIHASLSALGLLREWVRRELESSVHGGAPAAVETSASG